MVDLMGSRICGGNTAYKRTGYDFYPTPPEATFALLEYINLPKQTVIWEPACGEKHMVKAMEEKGYTVIGTDIQTGTDFLTTKTIPCDWVITNPPFSLSEQFIRRCRETGKPFALLLKSQFWHARKRYELFYEIKPSYVLPLTWRPDFLFKQRGNGSPLMDVLWCVWFPPYIGDTIYSPLRKPQI